MSIHGSAVHASALAAKAGMNSSSLILPPLLRFPWGNLELAVMMTKLAILGLHYLPTHGSEKTVSIPHLQFKFDRLAKSSSGQIWMLTAISRLLCCWTQMSCGQNQERRRTGENKVACMPWRQKLELHVNQAKELRQHIQMWHICWKFSKFSIKSQ